MTEITTLPAAEAPTGPTPGGRTGYRAAGWGAIVAALFYLLQPLAVFVLIPEATQEGFWASPATIPGTEWQGIYEVITFGGIAAATLVLVLALGRTSALASRVATAFGVIGAGGWLAVAGLSLAGKSLVARAMAEIGADQVVQQTAFQEGNVVLTGLIGIAAFGAAGWGIAGGLAGLRTSAWSKPVSGVALVGGVLILVLSCVAMHPIAGALVLIPLYLVLGIVLLVSARRARAGAGSA